MAITTVIIMLSITVIIMVTSAVTTMVITMTTTYLARHELEASLFLIIISISIIDISTIIIMSSISISIIYYYCCRCCCCYDNHRSDSLTARMDWQQLKSSVMQALVLRKTCCQPYLSAHNHLHNEPSCQYHSINYIYVVMIAPAASFCPD